MLRRIKEGAIRCSGCKKKRETGSEERKRVSVPSKCNGRVAEVAAEVLAEEAGAAADCTRKTMGSGLNNQQAVWFLLRKMSNVEI